MIKESETRFRHEQPAPAPSLRMRPLFHLVPLSPFDNDVMSNRSLLNDGDNKDNAIINHQDDGEGRRNSNNNNTFLFQPLLIPGSYGRFELLKPYIKVCPTCSRGCRRNNNLALKRSICGPTSAPILCNVCKSIQSMAKFIPRKEFWNFTYITTSNPCLIDEQLSAKKTTTTTTTAAAPVQLDIVGKEALKLVRISSSVGNIITPSVEKRRTNDDVSQCIELDDGEILSLLWYTDSGQSDKEKEKEHVDYSSSMLEPLIQFQLVRINSDTTTARTDASLEDNFSAAAAAADRRDSFKDDDSVSILNTTVMTKDGAVIDKDPHHDRRLEFSNNIHCDDNVKNDQIYQTEQIVQTKDEICYHGTSLESNSSAPLSLPSRFITARDSLSFSFDSTTHQHQSPLSLETKHTSLIGVDASPQKSYDSTTTTSRKRTVINFDDVDRTPKKSNITTSPNNINQYESIPISSFSYNQLVQLQQESIQSSNNLTNDSTNYNNNNIILPSLRHSVLSLTVALTSHNSNSKSTNDNNNNAHAEGRGVWMPRLLRNTHIRK